MNPKIQASFIDIDVLNGFSANPSQTFRLSLKKNQNPLHDIPDYHACADGLL